MADRQVAGLVLMGGQSRRMGTDKAFIHFQDQSLLAIALNQLKGITDQVYLSVNEDQFKQLHSQYDCIQDQYTNKGPIGGILTALTTLKCDLVVTAVDMPYLNHPIFERLISSTQEYKTMTCYKDGEEIQPFPSFWPYELYPIIEQSIRRHQLSMRILIKEVQPRLLKTADKENFKNLNCPKDLNETDNYL